MKKVILASAGILAVLSVAGCSADGGNDGGAASTDSSTKTSSSSAEAPSNVTIAAGEAANGTTVPGQGTLVMRQMYTAPHGTKSVAAVNVTMNGDEIVEARIDEFQYVDPADFKGVPNAEGAFGENFPKDVVLAGKEENNEAYSDMMKDHGGATQTWKQSMTAITDFVKGKTVSELNNSVKTLDEQGDDAKPSDVVSGATFSDTKGYLQAIVDTAQNGMVSTGERLSDTSNVKEAMVLGSPHGDKSFSVATVAMNDDKVAAVFVDEFQYVDPAEFGGLPNSDSDFGKGIKDGQVLASKEANNEAYSKMMKEHGKATQTWSESMQAINQFAVGKTVAELKEASDKLKNQGEDEKVSDVVSGATFSDTEGYLQQIIDAAEKAE